MTTQPLQTTTEDQPDFPPAVFDVCPVIDGDHDITTHAVRVQLTDIAWRELVGDIARAVYAAREHTPLYPLMLAAGRPTNDLDRVDALTKLVGRLNSAANPLPHPFPPMWDLTPEFADAMAMHMNDAADAPKVCACGNVVRQPTQLTTACEFCDERKGGA